MESEALVMHTSGGTPFLVDDEQWHREHELQVAKRLFYRCLPSELTWHMKNGYVRCSVLTANYEIRLHRLLLDAYQGGIIDHINGDRTDNRLSNLRFANHAGNARNRRSRRTLKGVYRRNNRWYAAIRVNHKRKWLGTFPTPEQAAAAYDQAAIEHFGEFAALNFEQSLSGVSP